MLVYMLETRRGSPDGFRVNRYHEGLTYDVPHTLAAHFVHKGWGLELPEEDLPWLNLSDAIPVNPEKDIPGCAIIPLPNKALRGSYMPGMAALRESEGL